MSSAAPPVRTRGNLSGTCPFSWSPVYCNSDRVSGGRWRQLSSPADSVLSIREHVKGTGAHQSMRLLVVSTIMPYPAIYGSAIRTWSLLRALANEGVQTTFLTFTSEPELNGDLRPLRELCRHFQTVYL